jgi:hypothetical protein
MMLFLIFVATMVGLVLLTKSKGDLHSHWNALIPDFKYSTQSFYQLLQKELQSKGVDGVITMEESIPVGGVISEKRLYLRVKWREYQYDCCFAPFGTGSFVSWWLVVKRSDLEEVLSRTPLIGSWLVKVFFPITYYRIDTASMFMTYAQNAVTKVIDDITLESGYRLRPEERKPQIKDVFQR